MGVLINVMDIFKFEKFPIASLFSEIRESRGRSSVVSRQKIEKLICRSLFDTASENSLVRGSKSSTLVGWHAGT